MLLMMPLLINYHVQLFACTDTCHVRKKRSDKRGRAVISFQNDVYHDRPTNGGRSYHFQNDTYHDK